MKMRKSFALLIVIFIFTFLIVLSFNSYRTTSYFLFQPSTFILIVFFYLLFYYIIRGEVEKKWRENLYALPSSFIEEIGKLYKVLKECGEENYNPKKTLSKVFPYIKRIVNEYSSILRELPPYLSDPFFTIYYSVEGKHGHYFLKRLQTDLKNLKKAAEELIRYAKRVH